MSKTERLATQSAKIEAGQVFLPREAPWLDDFLAEIWAFPYGKNDDQVDSFSQFLMWPTRGTGLESGSTASTGGGLPDGNLSPDRVRIHWTSMANRAVLGMPEAPRIEGRQAPGHRPPGFRW